jgi:hypothetical protein
MLEHGQSEWSVKWITGGILLKKIKGRSICLTNFKRRAVCKKSLLNIASLRVIGVIPSVLRKW